MHYEKEDVYKKKKTKYLQNWASYAHFYKLAIFESKQNSIPFYISQESLAVHAELYFFCLLLFKVDLCTLIKGLAGVGFVREIQIRLKLKPLTSGNLTLISEYIFTQEGLQD